MKSRKWLKELARDIIALGSLPFYLLVIARTVIGVYELFLLQLVTALVVLTAVSFFVKANMHIARGFVVFAFTSIFYKHMPFTLFAFAAWILALASVFYLKKPTKSIIIGVILGVAATAVAYFLAPRLQ